MILYQPKNGYCYNSDTMFLYDFISKFNIKGDVLEVGGGCGVLGLLIKRDFPKINLTIIEKQKVMYDFTLKNSKENNLEAEVINADFLEYKFDKKFNFIISNPPFYKGTLKSENEIKKIARYEEYLPMEEFFNKVNSLLVENGEFIFCYDAKRIDDIIKTLPKPLKITDMRFMYPRVNKNASLVMIRAKRHAKSMVKIHPPLIGLEGEEYSKEASEIYKKANTKSIKQ
ncbi:tRNA1(Val) (adenine(37)-N6)-methyltransferase [Caminibacter mediatlanticus]|uniref:Methyltransferase small n=1 Tax=Caminibacter mediatlanticus TB-2 TaxID=391592 RepID=A0AAI9F2L2_9BACT|nr:methyltransferase [Caminibacter mediatlanticus]EDM23706.1 Methyltransferase small [Caminibacter mediatlanticus TB-2]